MKSSFILAALICLLNFLYVSRLFACDVILPFKPSMEYVFIGKVTGVVGPFKLPKFPQELWGITVAPKESVQLPKKPESHFEVVPLRDCGWGGQSRADIVKHYPVGAEVLVVAKEAQILKSKLSKDSIRLERESDGYGFIAKNVDSSGARLTDGTGFFNYKEFANRPLAYRTERPNLAEFEYRKDLLRLKRAKTDDDKLKILERLVYYPCCTNLVAFKPLIAKFLSQPEKANHLIAISEQVQREYFEKKKTPD